MRLITDNKTRRSKGISYVEFKDAESVPLAMGLSGQKLLGVPIIVQASQAEKNRLANSQLPSQKGLSGPMRLYVGSLHFNITEEMLKGIFEPFGKVSTNFLDLRCIFRVLHMTGNFKIMRTYGIPWNTSSGKISN